MECVGGSTDCGGSCVQTANDATHCGGCGQVCAAGEVCADGQCGLVCGGSSTNCGDLCVNTANDPAHCGDCDTICPGDQQCVNGGCALECGAATPCGQLCVDTHVDRNNCGGCGQACAQNELCVAGACEADQDQPVTIGNSESPGSCHGSAGFSIHLAGIALNAPATVTHVGVWSGGANNSAKCYIVEEAQVGVLGQTLAYSALSRFAVGANEIELVNPVQLPPGQYWVGCHWDRGNNALCLDTGVPNNPYFWNMNLNNLGGNGPIDWSQQGLIWRPAGDFRFGYYLITR
jgi:hypothetical protein